MVKSSDLNFGDVVKIRYGSYLGAQNNPGLYTFLRKEGDTITLERDNRCFIIGEDNLDTWFADGTALVEQPV